MSDLKAQSNRTMEDLGENFIALEGQTDATMIATALDALRLATLYAGDQTAELVKQQNLANLITFMDLESGPFKDINHIEGAHETALRQISEGLGLA